MRIVTVIPFSRNIHKDSLTYFTAKDIAVGAIVSVPVRKKLVDAFVIETRDVLASKSDVKLAAFNLKKVEKVKGPSFLRPEFFKACLEVSNYFATHLGSVINALVPNVFIKHNANLQINANATNQIKDALKQEKLVFQAPLEDRLDFYKTFIRESFAKNSSVFLCLPTISEIKLFAEALEKGIEDYVFVLHSNLSNKDQLETYKSAVMEAHPVLIIATGSYLFIPRDDIGTIIVERESSGAYKMIQRPFIDYRVFAELFSYEIKARLIFGDTFLRIKTLWRHDQNELADIIPITFRMPTLARQEIVDMTTSQKHESTKTRKQRGEFEVLSDRVKEIIKKTAERGDHMFLFSLRKGLAPITVCNDCSTALLCDSCATPMTLFTKKDKGGRVFVCNKCKKQKSAEVVCGECGSWNLTPLGIGVERVVEELKKNFPDIPVFKIDQETTKTRKQGQKIIDEFYKTSGSILVGTEMALFYLSKKIKNTAIISFDSLFSLPSFRINEKIIQLLIKLLSHTEKKLIIQTRNPEEPVLGHISSGNLIQFYREELEQRRQFRYPPFTTFIKITFAGNKRDTDRALKTMKELFSGYSPNIFQAFTPKIKGRYITHMILKLDRQEWSLPSLIENSSLDENLLQKLRSLPPTYTIRVDPEDLL